MLVQDVVNMAKEGELSTLGIKDDDSRTLGYMNLGMIELYKRFPLKTEEYLFERTIGTEFYTMPSNLMWIQTAHGTVMVDGKLSLSRLAINEENNTLSVNTVSWNKIQVSSGVAAGDISLVYIASPDTYTVADLGKVIDLPTQLVEALLNYIGYRAHGALDGKINTENNTHYQRFEASCRRVELHGMFTPDDLDTSNRLSNRGFV
jgi:hypothetical protein